MNLNYPLILASNSPRRKEIMRNAGFDFETHTVFVDEDFPEDMPAAQIAEYLAVKKGKAYPDKFPQHIILTADTTVVLEDSVMNKPSDYAEAFSMIRSLSGRDHSVVTGVCIISPEKQISFSSETRVTFCELTDEEIDYYIKKYEPFDKAGAYGIQEWIGMIGIESIEGSFYNVAGLPIRKIYHTLKEEFTKEKV